MMNQIDEQLVIEKIKNGDKEELGVIYKTYQSEFVSWLMGRFRCTDEEAREIYQVAILTFYNNIIGGKLIKLNSSIKTYLFAIGKYKMMEQQKAAQKFIHNLNTSTAEEEYVEEKEPYERSLQQVEACLSEMGEPAKTLLELYYYHGYSMEKIAGMLNYKNADTAKNLKYKSIVKLRKMFKKAIETKF